MTLRLTDNLDTFDSSIPFRVPQHNLSIKGLSYIGTVLDYTKHHLQANPIRCPGGEAFVIDKIIYHVVSSEKGVSLEVSVFDPENPNDRLIVFVDIFWQSAKDEANSRGQKYGFLEDGPWVDMIQQQVAMMATKIMEHHVQFALEMDQPSYKALAENAVRVGRFRDLFPKGD